MNKRKEEIEKRKILNLMRVSNRKKNCLVFYPNETRNHKTKKFLVFTKLQELGFEVYSECIFKNGKRADVLAIKDGQGYGFEVLESETIEECEKKLADYPNIIEWRLIRTFKDAMDISKYL